MPILQIIRSVAIPNNTTNTWNSVTFLVPSNFPWDPPSGYTWTGIRFSGQLWAYKVGGYNWNNPNIISVIAGEHYGQGDYYVLQTSNPPPTSATGHLITKTETIFHTKNSFYLAGNYGLRVRSDGTGYESFFPRWQNVYIEFIYSKTAGNVSAGNLIQDTDFTAVGLTATEGTKITLSGMSGTITAAGFNSYTVVQSTQNYTGSQTGSWLV